MASSNRHWPSLFKSKACNPHQHQWQPELNPSSLLSHGGHRNPYSAVLGCEERSQEPKPRWNPRPEQIRILEAIFNSGMVNPPRDEITRIRAQLQEYGQVGDANVFYWFQNRKSRSKHKLRHLQNLKQQNSQQQNCKQQTNQAPAFNVNSIVHTASELAPKITKRAVSSNPRSVINVQSPSNGSMNMHAHNGLLPEPFFFPLFDNVALDATNGFAQSCCFSELANVVESHDHSNVVSSRSSPFFGDQILGLDMNKDRDEKNMKLGDPFYNQMSNSFTATVDLSPEPISTHANSDSVLDSISQIQGVGDTCSMRSGELRSTVFINDVPFDVAAGPFNIRATFGEDVLLMHSSGEPVLTNEWGVTLQSLEHGACYYLIPISVTSEASSCFEGTALKV